MNEIMGLQVIESDWGYVTTFSSEVQMLILVNYKLIGATGLISAMSTLTLLIYIVVCGFKITLDYIYLTKVLSGIASCPKVMTSQWYKLFGHLHIAHWVSFCAAFF